jgi:glycerophosphoryl diester phosphodiesterase
VLNVAAGETGLMLELKVAGVAPLTVQAVQKARFENPVIFASFLHDELTVARAIDPEAAVMVLFGRLPESPVACAMKYQPSYIGLRHDTATSRLVDAFHRENLRVCVYTPNSTGDIRHALSVGVDGVISNFPDRIGSLVQA